MREWMLAMRTNVRISNVACQRDCLRAGKDRGAGIWETSARCRPRPGRNRVREETAKMRKVLSSIAAGALLAFAAGGAIAQDKIKIGYAVSMTGPNAPGAGITTIPNYKLWIHDIEAAGGLMLGGKRVPVEVVTYDDQSSNEELIKAAERLINEDKVDILLSPWGTGMNLAVGPTFNKYGRPHMAATAATDMAYELGQRWPNSFWMLGTSTQGANALVEVLNKLKAAGKINNKIAMVSVADAFGIEL